MTTIRSLGHLLHKTARLFWHAPNELLAATWHHYFGDKTKANEWLDKAEAKTP